MFVIGVIAASLAAVAYGMSTVLRALGARRTAQEAREQGRSDQVTAAGGPSMTSTVSTFLDPSFVLGTMMVVVGFAGGAIAARFLPLFLSQTIVSANLIITALLGTVLLGIVLHARDWIAIGIVIVSLCLLGASSSHSTGGGEEMAFHWGLFGATLVLCAVALWAVYKLGTRGAIVGGLAGGLLFGVIAIAVRVLNGVHPIDLGALLLDPAAWTIAVAGAVGFYVQTVALQLGAVNGVTAVLVVGETAGPSIVGVMFLGDNAKPGFAWLAILGFVGAFIGAILVAWYGSVDADHFAEEPPLKGGWRRGREEVSETSRLAELFTDVSFRSAAPKDAAFDGDGTVDPGGPADDTGPDETGTRGNSRKVDSRRRS